jgi:sulfur-carrier protein
MRIVYFAAVREALARDEEELSLNDSISTISELLDHMAETDPAYARAFANRSKLRFALDQQMAKADASLKDAKELAIFPPVTGG